MSNFHPLEVVGRGSETQLQVGENLNCLILFTGSGIDFDIQLSSYFPQYIKTNKLVQHNFQKISWNWQNLQFCRSIVDAVSSRCHFAGRCDWSITDK